MSTRSAVGCPDQNALSAFHAGRLSDLEMEALAAHVGTCARCEQTLRELLLLPADSFEVGLLRACAGLTTSSSAPADPCLGLTADMPLIGDTASCGLPDTTGAQVSSPRTIGPYALVEVIGRGGMGVVYRAVHRVLQRTVALKTLHPGEENRTDALVRFRTEAKAVDRLEHPNVVRIFDFNECEGVPYLSMELVEGETLAQRLARGPLALREAADLVRTIAGAVEYAHGRYVIHRDLKPSNVLIARDGTPKVTDFGLAKVLDEGRGKLTETDAVMGTPAYMAPEQAAGRTTEVGPRTDVYALGAILYESLSGVPPFAAGTKFETLALVQAGILVPPSRHRPEIPSELEEVCLKCLEYYQNDRYASAKELNQALARWIEGKPTRTRRPGRWRRAVRAVGRTVRRRAAALLGAALLAAGLVGATAAVLTRTNEPTNAREVPTPLSEEIRAPDGGLLPFRIRYGADHTKVTADEDGTVTVHASGLCLIEYTRSPGAVPCRIRASLRHTQSNLFGLVGLYFGHRAVPSKFGEVHQFGRLVYNDCHELHGPRDLANASGMPLPFVPREPPFSNRVRLQVMTLAASGGEWPWMNKSELAAGESFPICRNRANCFRNLDVAVSQDGVSGWWAGRVAVSNPARELTDTFGTELNSYRQKLADPLPDSAGQFDPHGNIGIVIERSSASFRGFEVVPIEMAK